MKAWSAALAVALSLSLLSPVLAEGPAPARSEQTFAPVEQAVAAFMKQVGAQAGTVAVSVGGKLVYSRGIGFRDERRTQPTRPDDLMRIASVSKPITSAMVRDLVAAGKLSEDTKVFEYLKINPPPKAKVDPRLAQITVRHLLDHQGGWDRETAGDPMFKEREIQSALRLRAPPTPADVVRYMLGQPLQFDPGERKAYSNFGYCVLGRVVERATGKPYALALKEKICTPLKIRDLKVGRTRAKDRDAREVWYPVRDDAFSLDIMDAHGGIIASAPALCEFMKSYWVSGHRRGPGEKGQHWLFYGSLPGTTAMVMQRPDGIDVAVLLNGRRDASFTEDNDTLRKAVTAAIDAIPAPERQGR
jgi:N-acyl-D-amino-acid deacylase